MKKDWKYIVYLSVVIGLFVAVKLMSPKQYSWNVSLAHEVKDPYGTFALTRLLPSIFPHHKIGNSYKTIYELRDSLHQKQNIIILATRFDAGKEDIDVLLSHVESGATVLISANSFSGKLADTLALETYDNLFRQKNVFNRKDTAYVRFTNPLMDTTQHYLLPRDNAHNYFGKLDSAKATVIAKNDFDEPVTISIARGQGKLLLNCTPLMFTNIHLLSKNNSQFASQTLSYLPDRDVYRTEFYHLGRMEASTPLRFILTNEPLSWAYYILLFSILLFMAFESKRKQRIIPIIKPLSNTTLEFVATIGNLYYQSRDHKNIAEKKIQFFFDQIRNAYYVNTHQRDEHFITTLSGKSGQPAEFVRSLVTLIDKILTVPQVSQEELLSLNEQLEKFWNQQ